MNTNLVRADEKIRRSNSRAVEARQQWRAKYAVLVREIKAAKSDVRNDPQGCASKIRLESLQNMADMMMLDRAMIREDLVQTSYEWV